MLYKTPSYLISLLEVKLIKLPMYESAVELEDLELSAAILNHKPVAAQLGICMLLEKRETVTPNCAPLTF